MLIDVETSISCCTMLHSIIRSGFGILGHSQLMKLNISQRVSSKPFRVLSKRYHQPGTPMNVEENLL